MRVLLLTLLYSFFLFSQESVIEMVNPDCSSLKRLDGPGNVLEGHPIQHQGTLGTCYANTASLMLYSKFKKVNPDTDLKQISWLSLAQQTKKRQLNKVLDIPISKAVFDEGGFAGEVYQSIKGQNLCAIPTKDWSADEFNRSLESNAYLFEQMMNKYENLFEDKSNIESSSLSDKYISKTCFDNINHQFDNGLLANLNKARHIEEFSIFWKYLKNPKIENLVKFKDYYMTHIFTSTFKKGESNALRFLASDSFLLGPNEVFIDTALVDFIDESKMKSFKSDFYSNAYEVANAQQKTLIPLQSSLKIEFLKCVTESININPSLDKSTCSDKDNKKAQDLVDFTYFAAKEGVAPSFIKDVLTMDSPLKTKQEILTNFMSKAYKNCSYEVPMDWTAKDINLNDLLLTAKSLDKSAANFTKEVFVALVDMDLVGSISVSSNFLKPQDKRDENYRVNHAMSVIGSAKGCSIGDKKEQTCILIQNSYGLQANYQESNYPEYMIPALKVKDVTNFNGKKEYSKTSAYGKFWVCDPKAIERDIKGIGVIQ